MEAPPRHSEPEDPPVADTSPRVSRARENRVVVAAAVLRRLFMYFVWLGVMGYGSYAVFYEWTQSQDRFAILEEFSEALSIPLAQFDYQQAMKFADLYAGRREISRIVIHDAFGTQIYENQVNTPRQTYKMSDRITYQTMSGVAPREVGKVEVKFTGRAIIEHIAYGLLCILLSLSFGFLPVSLMIRKRRKRRAYP